MKFAPCFLLCVTAWCVVSSRKCEKTRINSTIEALHNINRLLNEEPLLKDYARMRSVREKAVCELQLDALFTPKNKKVKAVHLMETWMMLVQKYVNFLDECSQSSVSRGEAQLIDKLEGLSSNTNNALNYLREVGDQNRPATSQQPANCSGNALNCSSRTALMVLRDLRRVVIVASRILENIGKQCSLNCIVTNRSVKPIWYSVTAKPDLQGAKDPISVCLGNNRKTEKDQKRGKGAGSKQKKEGRKNDKNKKQKKRQQGNKNSKS